MQKNSVKIPECYEADKQYEAMDLAYTAKIMRRPRCVCCGNPLMGDTYLDLEEFGLKGYGCERCVNKFSYDLGDLDE